MGWWRERQREGWRVWELEFPREMRNAKKGVNICQGPAMYQTENSEDAGGVKVLEDGIGHFESLHPVGALAPGRCELGTFPRCPRRYL